MDTGKDTQFSAQAKTQEGKTMPADEEKRLTDFFSLLIQIDKRIAKTTNYGKQDK